MIEIVCKQKENVKQFNVALPPSLVAELDEAARRSFTSRSTLLRQGAVLLLKGLQQTDANRQATDNG